MIMIHELKILERYANKNIEGRKPWELRRNDRDFKEGDIVVFKVINDETKLPTGVTYRRRITYMFEGGEYGLDQGFCIMTIENI